MRLLSGRPAIIIAAVVAAVVAVLVASTLIGTRAGGGYRYHPAAAHQAAASPAAAPPPATAKKRVSPLNSAGKVAAPYKVVTAGDGYCWTSSFVNGRLYRCFEGNSILDPCWKQPGRAAVVCLPRPWSTHAVRVRLHRPLPPTNTTGPSLWGLRLGKVGVNCLVSMGASGTVGGQPVSFLCEHHWVLLGTAPDERQPVWSMATARWGGHHYRRHGTQPLTTSWVAVLP